MSAGNDIYDTHGRGKRNRILWSLPSTHRYLGRSVLISHSCAKPSHENCPGSSTSRSGQAFGLRWQKSRKSKAYSAAHNISTQHQHTAPASMRSQGMSVPGWPAGCLRVAPHLTSPHLTSGQHHQVGLCVSGRQAARGPREASRATQAAHLLGSRGRHCGSGSHECGTPCSSGGKQ